MAQPDKTLHSTTQTNHDARNKELQMRLQQKTHLATGPSQLGAAS
jgi:hypothetical protein